MHRAAGQASPILQFGEFRLGQVRLPSFRFSSPLFPCLFWDRADLIQRIRLLPEHCFRSAMSPSVHKPVMLREVLQQLQLSAGLTVMDGTVGAGGHSVEILSEIGESGQIIGFDRDLMMLDFARQRLSAANTTLIQAPYSTALTELAVAGVDRVDRVLLDLGLSSDQLCDRERGFGADAGGNLDMRFDTSAGVSAAEFLRRCSGEELVRVLGEYGEEPRAQRIADAILQQRTLSNVETSEELAEIVRKAVRSRGSQRYSIARVFQALRIGVNDELTHLKRMMAGVLTEILRPEGLAVIITFHSLEDRIVKSAFKGHQGWQVLTKTPLRATPAEVRLNPRSRSAKLRAARWTGL